MKKITLLSLSLLCACASAQLSYDFENGTIEGWIFNMPDRWSAETVSPINGSYSLHHAYDNSQSSSDAAMLGISGLCPECDTVTWEFHIRYGTDPSSSNKWSFILMSDASPSEIAAGNDYNGFAAGVNLTGYDDTLRLWHISEGKADAVITTGVNWQNDVGTELAPVIRIMRHPDGWWLIEMEVQGSGLRPEALTDEGASVAQGGVCPDLHKLGYAGILYTYTSSRDRLLWLDDVSVSGMFVTDTIPPSVVSVTAVRPDILQIVFDEEPEFSLTDYENFSLSGGVKVREITMITPLIYEIHLTGNIPDRTPGIMTINELCDKAGNCASHVTIPFVPAYALIGEVVISEIMADPSPPVMLPECEYLEIASRVSDSLSLDGWRLISGKDTVILPDVWIRAGERIILCPVSKEAEFSSSGRVIGLSSFPTLNDSGEVIALRDGCGSLIHAVSFTPAFYNDPLRSDGGWSAELTDMDNPFNEPDAWKASVDPSGGTPGRMNSAEIPSPDGKCPEVIAVWPQTPDMIRVLFNETVIPGDGVVWLIDGSETLPATSGDIADRSLIIRLTVDLAPGSVNNLLIPSSITDFAGNRPCKTDLKTGLPSDPLPGEIMFNELLFDPSATCADYAELYNKSRRIFDLSALSLTNGSGTGVIPVSDVPRQLLPGEYIALTNDRAAVLDHYNCADRFAVYEVDRLPSMPDDEGSLVLYSRQLSVIDRVDYTSSMHLLFLSGTEGIALEKVSPELSSGVPGNWHSASESCGWGTPGAENSNLLNQPPATDGMQLSSSRISPDCDGFEDILSVDVFPGGDDNVISVTVFNDRGYVVRKLAGRFAAGEGARFVWDGTSDSGSRLPAGLYMIMAESFNAKGVTQRWKKVCAVVYR